MKPIFGEYECKLDSKGRFLLPSGLKKQLPEDQQGEYVINRGLDKCLVLYPISVWEAELEKIFAKNQYVAANREFGRRFLNGASRVEPDGASRLLITKRLCEYAGLDKEIVLIAAYDRVEIWDQQVYEQWQSDDAVNLERLSEEVMGGQDGTRLP